MRRSFSPEFATLILPTNGKMP